MTQPDVKFANSITKWVVAAGVLIVGLAAWGITTGILRTQAATGVASEWFGHVGADRYADAFQMLEPKTRSSIDQEQLRTQLSKHESLRDYQEVKCRDYSQSKGRGKFKGSLIHSQGKTEILLELTTEGATDDTPLTVTGLVVEGQRVFPEGTAP